MPKVYITKTDKQIDSLYNFIIGTCAHRRIKHKEVAAVLGDSRQAYEYRLNNRKLTLNDFVLILDFLGEDVTKCIQ